MDPNIYLTILRVVVVWSVKYTKWLPKQKPILIKKLYEIK